jgi:hypothetical protein
MELNFAVFKALKLAFKESSVLVIMPDNSAVSVNAVAQTCSGSSNTT